MRIQRFSGWYPSQCCVRCCIRHLQSRLLTRRRSYVSALEARVQELERQLDAGTFQHANVKTGSTGPPRDGAPGLSHGRSHLSSKGTGLAGSKKLFRPDRPLTSGDTPKTNIFTLLRNACAVPAASLPETPSHQEATALLQSAYMYTQARYCIVDWIQVRKWHDRREILCSATPESDTTDRIGAYFLWLVYATGAQVSGLREDVSALYHTCAIRHLEAAVQEHDLTAVQALLALVQYQYRASDGPSSWQLVGVVLRLCIENSYHCKNSEASLTAPRSFYEDQLTRRFFWTAYLFDRMVSTVLRRPYGISDNDISVELPIDIDFADTDPEPSSAAVIQDPNSVTSMSSAIHHLRIYRLKSKIARETESPRGVADYQVVVQLLAELDAWKRQSPRHVDDPTIPQQTEERRQSIYLQTALQLMRPVLCATEVNAELLGKCASLAADACEVRGLFSGCYAAIGSFKTELQDLEP